MKNFNHFESIGLDELDSLIPNNKINTSYFESIGLEPLFQEDGDSRIGKTSLDAIGMSAAPRPHVIAEKSIEKKLDALIKKAHLEDWRAYDEMTISDKLNDKIPDVAAFKIKVIDKNKIDLDPRVVVEVTRHRDMEKEKRKGMYYQKRYPYAEIFIYEYEMEKEGKSVLIDKWHKLVNGEFIENCKYCDWLSGKLNVDKKAKEDMRKLFNDGHFFILD